MTTPFTLKPFATPTEFQINGLFETTPESNFFIKYQLSGNISDLKFPKLTDYPKRADHLWQQSCFELFIQPESHRDYLEFNFSPAKHWNVYQFNDYRKQMTIFLPINQVIINRSSDQQDFILTAEFDFKPLLLMSKQFYIGISAVLASTDGELFYWALNHADDKPDFHNKNSFLLRFIP